MKVTAAPPSSRTSVTRALYSRESSLKRARQRWPCCSEGRGTRESRDTESSCSSSGWREGRRQAGLKVTMSPVTATTSPARGPRGRSERLSGSCSSVMGSRAEHMMAVEPTSLWQ